MNIYCHGSKVSKHHSLILIVFGIEFALRVTQPSNDLKLLKLTERIKLEILFIKLVLVDLVSECGPCPKNSSEFARPPAFLLW